MGVEWGWGREEEKEGVGEGGQGGDRGREGKEDRLAESSPSGILNIEQLTLMAGQRYPPRRMWVIVL